MDIKSVLLDFVNWNNENHSDYIPNSRDGRYILETKCEGKESPDESSNCIKPDVNVRFLFDMGIKYGNELAEETGQKLHDDTARMVAKDYTKHVAHFLKNAR